jgi:sugar phosphate isomerase/epimerase
MAQSPSSSSAIRLGIASYTFRNFDQEHLIQFMKELRTPYLNLKDVHLPMTPADQVATRAQQYRDAGLTLTAAGTISFQKDDDDDIRSKFEYVKAAGIPIIVAAPTHQVLPRIEKFVKQYDIKLAIHNHGPEDKNFPSPLDVLDAVKSMDPRIGCCIDVGHTMRTGTDVVAAIRKAGPRLHNMHMKDLAQAKVKESQVAVGDGVMPVREIFRALVDMHYPGNVDLEYEIHADDPMPGVIKSFAFMRGVIAGMNL